MMDLREALQAEHSKAQTLRITKHIGASQKRFGELVAIVTGDDPLLAQRAAWVITHVAESRPAIVKPFLRELLEFIQRPNLHDAIKRNTMKAASLIDLPDDLAGLAADLAFDLLASPAEAVATKVYSMSVLEKLCEREPELAGELRLHIQDQLPTATKAAFHSKARHVLKTLDRIAPLDG